MTLYMHEYARAQFTVSSVVIQHRYQRTYISVFVDGHYGMANSKFRVYSMPINVETTVNEVSKSFSDLETREVRILEDFLLFSKTAASLVLEKNAERYVQGRK